MSKLYIVISTGAILGVYPTLEQTWARIRAVEAEAGPGVDIAVICTNHTAFSYPVLPTRFPLVLDTRNALKGVSGANIFRL